MSLPMSKMRRNCYDFGDLMNLYVGSLAIGNETLLTNFQPAVQNIIPPNRERNDNTQSSNMPP